MSIPILWEIEEYLIFYSAYLKMCDKPIRNGRKYSNATGSSDICILKLLN
jgi:hypothetical protein